MDETALRERLLDRAAAAVDEMMAAMREAPKDNIVGGSEWQVHDAADAFKRECFEVLVGERVKEAEAEHRGSFSPGAGRGGAGGPGAGA